MDPLRQIIASCNHKTRVRAWHGKLLILSIQSSSSSPPRSSPPNYHPQIKLAIKERQRAYTIDDQQKHQLHTYGAKCLS